MGAWSDAWIAQISARVSQINVGTGPTVSRPSTATVGSCYYDTDLDHPVWYSTAGIWVDSSGHKVK